MPTSFLVGSKRAVVAIAVILMALVCGALYIVQEQTNLRTQLDRTREAIAQAKEALVQVISHESDYRGLVAIKEQPTVSELPKSRHTVPAMPVTFQQFLTSHDPLNDGIVADLFNLHQTLMGKTVTLDELRKMADKEVVADLEKRQAALEKYRTLTGDLIAFDQATVAQRREKARMLWEQFYAAFAMLAIGGLSGLLWLYRATDHYVSEKSEALMALEKQNDDLQKARDEAVRANLLKSQFVANISHEIRTPMNGILGLSELLTHSEADEDGMAKHIHDAALSLMTILNDLLDFSKLEAGRMQLNPTTFNTAELIEEVVTFMSVNFDAKGIALETSVDEALNRDFYGDRDRIRQVLLNLIHNALKFTEAGKVTITAKIDKYYQDEAFVRFEIVDTGAGIAKEARARLFEPFVQADMSSTRRHGGTGLGLSISKSLVELMHGAIDCQTAEGKGSTFSFVVPLKAKLETAVPKTEKAETLKAAEFAP